MGAIYLDLGYIAVKKVVDSIIIPYIENPNINFFSDYKSVLQEYIQTTQKSFEYVLLEESGPAHNKTFKTAIKIDDIVYGIGEAGSKKESEQEAAKSAIQKLQIK